MSVAFGNHDDSQAREVTRLYRSHLGAAASLLDDKDITDIYRNAHSDQIWTISATKGKQPTIFQQTTEHAMRFLGVISSFYDTEISRFHPRLSCALPFHGARLHALVSPIVAGVAWVLRKPTTFVPTLESYAEAGIIPNAEMLSRIRSYLTEKLNILIVGGMGSGKTTLLNATLAEIANLFPRNERYALIEDTDELRCTAPDYIKMMTVEANRFGKSDYNGIGYPELVADALRLSATRIMLGEIRYGASVILDAWRTGHDGNAGTIHGGSPDEGMGRLEFLLRRENYPIDRREIMATVHALIVMRKVGSARVVRDAVRITGVTDHGYIFSKT